MSFQMTYGPDGRLRVAILGCTGSIGTQALDVCRQHADRLQVTALSVNSSTSELVAAAREFSVPAVAVADVDHGDDAVLQELPEGTQLGVGAQAVCELARRDDVDCVLVAIVGAAGLEASHAALTSNKRLALANKESLVVGGDLLMPLAQPGQLIPVDSEHSAIYQCYLGENPREAHCIWLTCSGGPFLRRMDLTGVTVEEASTHPRWKMGRKITVDSATLMNKALEVIEARWLFDIPPERIRVVIHPQSILHSGVAFEDGAVMAELGVPDMRTPIAVAMAWPERTESGAAALDFTKLKEPLTFEAPDLERFPQLKLAWEALEAGGSATIVLNAANEAAVAAFLDRKISFLGIGRACREALSGLVLPAPKSLSDIYAADREARSFVDSLICSGRIS